MSPASGDGTGEPVEFGDDEGVSGADGGEGLVQSGSGAAGCDESVAR